ncbi:MAG: CopG family antitoxin [Anaerolineae bacterium]
MAKIPEFSTLEEAATFWDTHDFEDYIEDTEPVTFEVKIPRRRKSLTIQLKPQIYDKIEALAAERGVQVESLILSWLQEKVRESI